MIAESYVRVKQSIGVVCTTSGLGSTNAVPGLAEARIDTAAGQNRLICPAVPWGRKQKLMVHRNIALVTGGAGFIGYHLVDRLLVWIIGWQWLTTRAPGNWRTSTQPQFPIKWTSPILPRLMRFMLSSHTWSSIWQPRLAQVNPKNSG